MKYGTRLFERSLLMKFSMFVFLSLPTHPTAPLLALYQHTTSPLLRTVFFSLCFSTYLPLLLWPCLPTLKPALSLSDTESNAVCPVAVLYLDMALLPSPTYLRRARARASALMRFTWVTKGCKLRTKM